MKPTLLLPAVIALALAGASARAETPAAPAAPPAAAAGVLRVDAKDKDALIAAKGKQAVVFGSVRAAQDTAKGISFVNFEGDVFTVVCFEKDYKNFKEALPGALYDGKKVEVTGEVIDYKGKLEIKITSPDQVKIMGAAEVAPKKEGAGMKKDDKAAKPAAPAGGEKTDDKKDGKAKPMDPSKFFK